MTGLIILIILAYLFFSNPIHARVRRMYGKASKLAGSTKGPTFGRIKFPTKKIGTFITCLAVYVGLVYLVHFIPYIWNAWWSPESFFWMTNAIAVLCIFVGVFLIEPVGIVGMFLLFWLIVKPHCQAYYYAPPQQIVMSQPPQTPEQELKNEFGEFLPNSDVVNGVIVPVQITMDHPARAWLVPGKTRTIVYQKSHSEVGAMYIYANDSTKVFYDTVPEIWKKSRHNTPEYQEYLENHEAWLDMPPGAYFVYPVGIDHLPFIWWQN